MKVMLTPNEVAARVWDDYLHRFGAEAYVTARYIAARRRFLETKTPA
jgi:hypothetical protein